MNGSDLITKMREAFPDDIMAAKVLNINEVYVAVHPDKAFDVCAYCYEVLCYPLVSMFANDEQRLTEQFAVYYAFADRENALLLIIKTYVDPGAHENPVDHRKSACRRPV